MGGIDLGADDGFVNVAMGDVSLAVDLWDVNNKLAELHDRMKDRPPNEYNDAVAQLVEQIGFPRPSHRMGQRFAEAIIRRTNEASGKSSKRVE